MYKSRTTESWKLVRNPILRDVVTFIAIWTITPLPFRTATAGYRLVRGDVPCGSHPVARRHRRPDVAGTPHHSAGWRRSGPRVVGRIRSYQRQSAARRTLAPMLGVRRHATPKAARRAATTAAAEWGRLPITCQMWQRRVRIGAIEWDGRQPSCALRFPTIHGRADCNGNMLTRAAWRKKMNASRSAQQPSEFAFPRRA